MVRSREVRIESTVTVRRNPLPLVMISRPERPGRGIRSSPLARSVSLTLGNEPATSLPASRLAVAGRLAAPRCTHCVARTAAALIGDESHHFLAEAAEELRLKNETADRSGSASQPSLLARPWRGGGATSPGLVAAAGAGAGEQAVGIIAGAVGGRGAGCRGEGGARMNAGCAPGCSLVLVPMPLFAFAAPAFAAGRGGALPPLLVDAKQDAIGWPSGASSHALSLSVSPRCEAEAGFVQVAAQHLPPLVHSPSSRQGEGEECRPRGQQPPPWAVGWTRGGP